MRTHTTAHDWKVSLIDTNRATPQNQALLAKQKAESKEIKESFQSLSKEDRELAVSQDICPVSKVRLGTKGMGTPINVKIN